MYVFSVILPVCVFICVCLLLRNKKNTCVLHELKKIILLMMSQDNTSVHISHVFTYILYYVHLHLNILKV